MSIDREVYTRPALCARSRLRKVGHLQPDPAAQHGFLERSVNLSEALNDLQRPIDRMPVEGIAKGLPLKTILSDYIGHRDGTLERIHHALVQQCTSS